MREASPKGICGLQAVHAGHVRVDQRCYELWGLCVQVRKRRSARCRLDRFETEPAQQLCRDLKRGRLVVDHEDRARVSVVVYLRRRGVRRLRYWRQAQLYFGTGAVIDVNQRRRTAARRLRQLRALDRDHHRGS